MFYQNLKELEIETSSICNAACPMCLRDVTPNDKTWFEETYLDADFYENRIPDHVWEKITSVLFYGILGDPCAAPNFLEVCEVVKRKAPHAAIRVSTNGGLRSEDFWKKLAAIFTKDDTVTFAIDGLRDTNHIYRVNVNFDKVMANAKTFINSGGKAWWQWIGFKHNQHQVEVARSLATEMGFDKFYEKPSHRFVFADNIGGVKYGGGNVLLESPTVNAHPLVYTPKFSFDEWHKDTNSSNINCYAQDRESIYIDATGNLFPCCSMASGQMYHRVIDFKDGWNDIWDQFGGDKINLKHTEWDDIVNGPFFTGVMNRWGEDYTSGRLAVCASVCSDSKFKFNNKVYTKKT